MNGTAAGVRIREATFSPGRALSSSLGRDQEQEQLQLPGWSCSVHRRKAEMLFLPALLFFFIFFFWQAFATSVSPFIAASTYERSNCSVSYICASVLRVLIPF